MGATRKLTVFITNERFIEDIVEGSCVLSLPQELTTRLQPYETDGELTFYDEVLNDPASMRLCQMQGVTLGEHDPVQFMTPDSVFQVRPDNACDITLTHADDTKLEVHDDMEFSACTVAELADAYAPLHEKHPMCDIKLRQDSPVLYQLLQDLTWINKVSENSDRILLLVWE